MRTTGRLLPPGRLDCELLLAVSVTPTRLNGGSVSSLAEPCLITPGDLFSLPLDVLLAAAGALLVESSIPDVDFFGAVLVSPAGLSLHLPRERPAAERDTVARLLLARVLGVPTTPLPAGLVVEEAEV
ncbi:hypothetical protein [Streptomyces sp. WAC08241]|uniref:hypothetical protein n=1 Tax=Streptomyces sp. WAC08241 TaxID=2487421 RepID=UPI000F79B2F1|nr:hypothetical protein [Streptomyces sp. WAC08241]RSS46224.1 hypothetical protein EF906_02645 [Streptomyces sp. WAC08241]